MFVIPLHFNVTLRVHVWVSEFELIRICEDQYAGGAGLGALRRGLTEG